MKTKSEIFSKLVLIEGLLSDGLNSLDVCCVAPETWFAYEHLKLLIKSLEGKANERN